MVEISKSDKQILKQARDTYGNKNQILVCIEELNELACVLAKYPRYEDHNKAVNKLYDDALDEVADVIIILDHVKAIFGLGDQSVEDRISKKLERLNRWLDSSESFEQTTKDRAVVNSFDTYQKERFRQIREIDNKLYGKD